MRNIIFLFIGLLFLNCEKEAIVEEIIMEDTPCYDHDLVCKGYYEVELWFNDDDVPDNVIIAHDGFKAPLGQVMKFEAIDIPGWRFVGWRKLPNSYCEYKPLVDGDNPRIAYAYMHEKYMGNCNIGPLDIRLYSHYIKVLD